MKDEIADRLRFNLERVDHLVDIYERVAGQERGRKPPKLEDILRAATVLLHASLEDFLRSIELWRLPLAAPDALKGIPIVGPDRVDKVTLVQLAGHRGTTIDDLIGHSVGEYLARATYNNPGQVKSSLRALGLLTPDAEAGAEAIAPMMTRRHHIVHQADRSTQSGTGYNRTQTIAKSDVRYWRDTVASFAQAVLSQLL